MVSILDIFHIHRLINLLSLKTIRLFDQLELLELNINKYKNAYSKNFAFKKKKIQNADMACQKQ